MTYSSKMALVTGDLHELLEHLGFVFDDSSVLEFTAIVIAALHVACPVNETANRAEIARIRGVLHDMEAGVLNQAEAMSRLQSPPADERNFERIGEEDSTLTTLPQSTKAPTTMTTLPRAGGDLLSRFRIGEL